MTGDGTPEWLEASVPDLPAWLAEVRTALQACLSIDVDTLTAEERDELVRDLNDLNTAMIGLRRRIEEELVRRGHDR